MCTGLAFALIVSSSVTATASLAAPLTAFEAKKLQPQTKVKKTLTHEQRVQVRASEEKRIAKSQEKAYKKQMQALEKYYRKLALDVNVRKHSGNRASLLATTEHFKQLSKEIKNSKKVVRRPKLFNQF